MSAAFLSRLRALSPLGDEEIGAFAGLLSEPRRVATARPLLNEGEQPRRMHILADGWAARAKLLPDGRRHLSALIVAGDICDVDGLLVRTYDYSVVALSPSTVVTAERDRVLALCDRYPAIARALTFLGFVDNAMLSEAATSLARRSARQRLAHLLCELRRRLAAVGRAGANEFELRLSQEKIGDALGLTAVHVNRTLRDLRLAGLATFTGQRVIAADWGALEREAEFSPAYLHLDGMR